MPSNNNNEQVNSIVPPEILALKQFVFLYAEHPHFFLLPFLDKKRYKELLNKDPELKKLAEDFSLLFERIVNNDFLDGRAIEGHYLTGADLFKKTYKINFLQIMDAKNSQVVKEYDIALLSQQRLAELSQNNDTNILAKEINIQQIAKDKLKSLKHHYKLVMVGTRKKPAGLLVGNLTPLIKLLKQHPEFAEFAQILIHDNKLKAAAQRWHDGLDSNELQILEKRWGFQNYTRENKLFFEAALKIEFIMKPFLGHYVLSIDEQKNHQKYVVSLLNDLLHSYQINIFDNPENFKQTINNIIQQAAYNKFNLDQNLRLYNLLTKDFILQSFKQPPFDCVKFVSEEEEMLYCKKVMLEIDKLNKYEVHKNYLLKVKSILQNSADYQYVVEKNKAAYKIDEEKNREFLQTKKDSANILKLMFDKKIICSKSEKDKFLHQVFLDLNQMNLYMPHHDFCKSINNYLENVIYRHFSLTNDYFKEMIKNRIEDESDDEVEFASEQNKSNDYLNDTQLLDSIVKCIEQVSMYQDPGKYPSLVNDNIERIIFEYLESKAKEKVSKSEAELTKANIKTGTTLFSKEVMRKEQRSNDNQKQIQPNIQSKIEQTQTKKTNIP